MGVARDAKASKFEMVLAVAEIKVEDIVRFEVSVADAVEGQVVEGS